MRLISRMGASALAKARNSASRMSHSSSGLISARTVLLSLLLTVKSSTPSSVLRMPQTVSSSARISSLSVVVPANRVVRFSGVSLATSFPLEMIMIESHTACTSLRIWLDKTSVCSLPSSRISSRISMICAGSRPTVGSSRMITSGFPSSACAIPTRCL